MCLGIPGLVIDVTREDDLLMGRVEFGGVRKRICLDHVPEVQPGDYVLVHVGFALSRIDAAEARRIFEFLEGEPEAFEADEAGEGSVEGVAEITADPLSPEVRT